MARALHNIGEVKCQPFLKHSNHWKWSLKRIFKGNRSTIYQTQFTTSYCCFIGVQTSVNNCK